MIIVISYIPHFIVIVQHIKTESEATYNLKNKGVSRCHRTGVGNVDPGGPLSCRL